MMGSFACGVRIFARFRACHGIQFRRTAAPQRHNCVWKLSAYAASDLFAPRGPFPEILPVSALKCDSMSCVFLLWKQASCGSFFTAAITSACASSSVACDHLRARAPPHHDTAHGGNA